MCQGCFKIQGIQSFINIILKYKYQFLFLTKFVESSICHCVNMVIIVKMTTTSHKQPIWFSKMKGTAGAVWLTWLVYREAIEKHLTVILQVKRLPHDQNIKPGIEDMSLKT